MRHRCRSRGTGIGIGGYGGSGRRCRLGLWFALMFLLSPFLSFMALGTAPFVALALSAITMRTTISRPCSAPGWAQRHRFAFWLGVGSFLTYACVITAIEIPQVILFWPR